MSGLYAHNLNFSPASAVSPHMRTNPDVDSQYLTELLAEHQKFEPFMEVLPICSRLLNRVSGMISNQGFSEYARLQRGSPTSMASLKMMPDVGGKVVGGWNGNEWNGLCERFGGKIGMTMDWHAVTGSLCSYTVKRVLPLEIPVNSYPNFNFVGRLLGPCGNFLKRLEASTGCHVFIRGKGSIEDPDKAREIIEELLKPVDKSHDFYKRQQLRELAMPNSNFREESPRPRTSVSPSNSSRMKCARTGW